VDGGRPGPLDHALPVDRDHGIAALTLDLGTQGLGAPGVRSEGHTLQLDEGGDVGGAGTPQGHDTRLGLCGSATSGRRR